jgi:hypothetical protein
MSSSSASASLDRPRAVSVVIDDDFLRVTVTDGREIRAPIAWFDWLANAADHDRRDFRLLGGGAGIWWDRLDEGISVPWLFGLPEDL